MKIICLIIVCLPFLSFSLEERLLLSLERAEEMALKNNKQILALKELYLLAKEGKFESITKWLPQVQALSYAYATQKVIPLSGGKSTFLTQLSLTQSLFSSENYFNIKLASLHVKHIGLLLDALVNDILYQVRSIYYMIALDYENILTSEEHIAILEELAIQMQDSYRIGTTILLNVNQSKVAIANATKQYYQRVKNLKVHEDALVELIGYDPGTKLVQIEDRYIPLNKFDEIESKLQKIEAIFANQKGYSPIYREGFPGSEESIMAHLYSVSEVEEWESISQVKNPLVRTLLNEVDIANEEVKKRFGEYLPTLSLAANYGGEPIPFWFFLSDKFTNQSFSWGAGVQLSWNLFDGLGRESRIRQSRLNRSSKQYSVQHQKQTTLKSVREQIFKLEEGVANYATSDGNVRLADQALIQAKDQFDIGYITIFDYLNAVNSLIEAKDINCQAAYDLVYAYYGLRHTSGIDIEGDNS
jgi:outer membrane protein TolC